MIKVLECEVWQKLQAIWRPSHNCEMEKGRDKPISPSLVSKETRPHIESAQVYLIWNKKIKDKVSYENKIICNDDKTVHVSRQ